MRLRLLDNVRVEALELGETEVVSGEEDEGFGLQQLLAQNPGDCCAFLVVSAAAQLVYHHQRVRTDVAKYVLHFLHLSTV